jgi:hypothetical protein
MRTQKLEKMRTYRLTDRKTDDTESDVESKVVVPDLSISLHLVGNCLEDLAGAWMHH